MRFFAGSGEVLGYFVPGGGRASGDDDRTRCSRSRTRADPTRGGDAVPRRPHAQGRRLHVGCTPIGDFAHARRGSAGGGPRGPAATSRRRALEAVSRRVDLAKRMLDPAAEPTLDFTRAAERGARAPAPVCWPRRRRRLRSPVVAALEPLAVADPEPLEAAAVADSGVTVVPVAPSVSSARRDPAPARVGRQTSASRWIVSTR